MTNQQTEEMSAVLASAATPPKAMTAPDIEDAKRQAIELVSLVRHSSGSRQLALLDEVSSVGVTSQRNSARQLELVKTRMATLLDDGGPSRDIGAGLVDLRVALDRINPHMHEKSLWGRTVGMVPFLRNGVLVRRLKKIAVRYEPVSKQVVVIETRLREGRSLLVRDNVELRRLYEDVETQEAGVDRQIFIGELLLHELTSLAEHLDDPLERDRILSGLHDVALRVQDLRTMQEVHLQYRISIDLTRTNNNRLGQAVDRTLTMATNVVTVGLALQAALVRQKAVAEASAKTREFLGEMIAQNAAAIRRQTDEIGDLFNQPVIAMDKLVQAHEDLLAALEAAGRLRENGIVVARQNIEQLTGLTRELSEHVESIADGEGAT